MSASNRVPSGQGARWGPGTWETLASGAEKIARNASRLLAGSRSAWATRAARRSSTGKAASRCSNTAKNSPSPCGADRVDTGMTFEPPRFPACGGIVTLSAVGSLPTAGTTAMSGRAMAGSYGGIVQTGVAVGLQAARPASLRCLRTGTDRVVGWIRSPLRWKLLWDVAGAARLARGCMMADQACGLARWVGRDGRPVTASRVLRRADVAAAGAVVGVPVPARVRTAADAPVLHQP